MSEDRDIRPATTLAYRPNDGMGRGRRPYILAVTIAAAFVAVALVCGLLIVLLVRVVSPSPAFSEARFVLPRGFSGAFIVIEDAMADDVPVPAGTWTITVPQNRIADRKSKR